MSSSSSRNAEVSDTDQQQEHLASYTRGPHVDAIEAEKKQGWMTHEEMACLVAVALCHPQWKLKTPPIDKRGTRCRIDSSSRQSRNLNALKSVFIEVCVNVNCTWHHMPPLLSVVIYRAETFAAVNQYCVRTSPVTCTASIVRCGTRHESFGCGAMAHAINQVKLTDKRWCCKTNA